MERSPDMERSRWRTGHEEEYAMGRGMEKGPHKAARHDAEA